MEEDVQQDELLAKTRHSLQTHLNEPSLNIMVYAYANPEGLSKACLRENRTKAKDLPQFVGQFNARYPLFNFIDVGYGDQRADCKIQGESWSRLIHHDRNQLINARTGKVLSRGQVL